MGRGGKGWGEEEKGLRGRRLESLPCISPALTSRIIRGIITKQLNPSNITYINLKEEDKNVHLSRQRKEKRGEQKEEGYH